MRLSAGSVPLGRDGPSADTMTATDPLRAHVRVIENGKFTWAVLDRPAARNAIDSQVVDELHELCSRLEQSPSILAISGSNGIFASGADIRELRDRGSGDALKGINSRIFDRIANLPLPTIAVIDGAAIGGGAELAYACDFRIASTRAKFANPEATLGIIAGAGACWRLRQLVGLPLATEILLAGRRLDAEESLACGLVTKVVSPDELDAAVTTLVDRISRGSPMALRLSKLSLKASPSAHPVLDDVAQAVLFESDEKFRRMDSFLEGGTAS